MAKYVLFRFSDQEERYPDDIALVSQIGGVYGIFDRRGRCIYVGKADDDMADRLAAHEDDTCVKQRKPVYYKYECWDQIKGELSDREKHLIRAYKKKGEAPCNDRVG